eukprot:SAG11_NODE_1138_length_5724_cov_188.276978_7_plen_127_part_00
MLVALQLHQELRLRGRQPGELSCNAAREAVRHGGRPADLGVHVERGAATSGGEPECRAVKVSAEPPRLARRPNQIATPPRRLARFELGWTRGRPLSAEVMDDGVDQLLVVRGITLWEDRAQAEGGA